MHLISKLRFLDVEIYMRSIMGFHFKVPSLWTVTEVTFYDI